MAFVGRVEELKSSSDPKFQLDKEARFIKRKIEEIEAEMKQMDRNMGMFNFKSASGEAMKKDMEKKIERAREDIERLRKQHRQLMQEMRGPVAPKAEEPAAPTAEQAAPPSAKMPDAPTADEQTPEAPAS
mgnify:CR=1 FL=1